ncbi:MAG: OmpA family protein [Bacteroidetes bacterium]|nr:MAG: OmpA family protein [Bacteroidota bacterium]
MFTLVLSIVTAQETIKLNNPSFEDTPRAGGLGFSIPIRGWHDCARAVYPDQSPPDIHPHPEAWMVSVDAQNGNTFLGMVVRDNESHEFISQALEVPLKGGQCYSFSIFLAQSETYMGVRNGSAAVTNAQAQALDTSVFSSPFMKPAVLRIWGGRSICSKGELLGVSAPVTNRDWKEYQFKFEPDSSLRYITLEAFYVTPVLSAYNGHILLDQASAIVQLACDEELPPVVVPPAEVVVVLVPPEKPKVDAPPPPPKPEQPVEEIAEDPKPVILTDLDREKIVAGQKIRVKSLYFRADSSRIRPESYPVLDEIQRFLIKNPDVIVEIGGHTSTGPSHAFCDALSEARAKAVTEYLLENGVEMAQLSYKGYGKRYPIVRDDQKDYKSARKKNQRVEIKVLSLDGD